MWEAVGESKIESRLELSEEGIDYQAQEGALFLEATERRHGSLAPRVKLDSKPLGD